MSDKTLNMNNNAENKSNLQQNPALSPYQQMLLEQQQNYSNQQDDLSPYQRLLKKQGMQQKSPYGQSEPYGATTPQNNGGMPEVIISPPLETVKEEILEEFTADDSNELDVDGHKVFVRQPVIEHDDKNVDLIVNEPANGGSIFSAPTPVYDPNATSTQAVPLNVQPKEPEQKAQVNSQPQGSKDFLNSMRSFYSALGENKDIGEPEIKAPNVSDEPLPSFTSNADILDTNEESRQPKVPNVGFNKNIVNNAMPKEEPKEFSPAQSSDLDGLKKNTEKIQTGIQKEEVDNKQDDRKSQASFLIEMLKKSDDVVQPDRVQTKPAQPISVQAKPQFQEQSLQNAVKQEFVNPINQKNTDEKQSPVQSFQNEPPQTKPVHNVQQAQNIPQQNEQVKDEQYWTYMNSLLERFDDGSDSNDAVNNKPIQEESVSAQPDGDIKNVLEQFGQSIDKPEDDNMFSKAFKKAQDDLVGDDSDFEESFNINMDTVLPKKKGKKKNVKKTKVPKTEKKSVDGSLGGFFSVREKKEKSKKNTVVLIVIAVVLALVVFFGVFFGKKGANNSDNKKLNKLITTSESADASWRVIEAKYPGVSFPEEMQKKYTDLYALNKDFVGWLSIKGLDIELPVVQNDNYQFYLNHNFKKKKSGYGTTFMQSDNSVESLNLNTIIYGQSMKTDSQMFTKLKEYKTIEGYKKAPVIEFNTLYKDYKWKVFAAFITNAEPKQDNGYLFKFNFIELPWEDEVKYVQLFDEYIHSCRERSLYNTGVDVKADDKLLTLTTTSNEFKGARLVVVARMVRDGESTEVPFALVKENKSPRYPQAWYDKKRETNNYKKDDTWDPNSLAE